MVSYTEIESKEFNLERKGYSRPEVDAFLDEVAETVENLSAEIEDLKKQLDSDDEEKVEYEKMKGELHRALITAHKTSDSIIENAKVEAEKLTRELNEKLSNIDLVAEERIQEKCAEVEAENEELRQRALAMFAEKEEEAEEYLAEQKTLADEYLLSQKQQANEFIEARKAETEAELAARLEENTNLYDINGNVINASAKIIELRESLQKMLADLPELK